MVFFYLKIFYFYDFLILFVGQGFLNYGLRSQNIILGSRNKLAWQIKKSILLDFTRKLKVSL